MENEKEISEYVYKNVLKGLDLAGVPHETHFNSMTIPPTSIKKLWRPNNYRRQIEVKEKTNSTISALLSTIPNINYSKHTKILTAVINGITIQYFKNCIVGIYEQPKPKRWLLIERETLQDIDKELEIRKQEIQEQIDTVLNKVVAQFDLNIGKPITWLRSENSLKNDEFLESIPRDMIMYDTTFRKVYADDVEFISKKGQEPLTHIQNYIHNRAIENISPEINKEISKLSNQFAEFEIRALNPLTQQIELHLKVLDNINKNQEQLNTTLNKLNNTIQASNGTIRQPLDQTKTANSIPHYLLVICPYCQHKWKTKQNDSKGRVHCNKCKGVFKV